MIFSKLVLIYYLVVTSGKKEGIDSSDLRHMLKRKVDPPGGGRSESKVNIDEREKRRRKDKEDSSKAVVGGKSRQAESRRKKQHGKFHLCTKQCICYSE